MVRYLLSREEADAQAITACLLVAIEKKQLKLVELLIRHGIDVNAADAEDKTLLYYAIHSGLVNIVRMLVNHGADANQIASRNGYSAAFEMATRAEIEMPKAVARIKGAHVDFGTLSEQLDHHPIFAPQWAGKLQSYAICEKLLMNTPISILDQMRFDPLMHASAHGHLEAVQALVEYGAAINFQPDCSTPLILASEAGHFEVVQYLCENGADVNLKRDDDDVAPLIAAARKGRLEIVEYLLEEQHADVSIRSVNQETALDETMMRGFCDVVRVLLFHSAELLASEEDQSGLLCLAVIHNRVEMAKLLEQFGADVNARYPVHSPENGKPIVVTPLIVAARSGSLEIVKFLCENGADVEITTERNESPLAFAVVYGRLKMVKYSVEERNANLDCVDTALNYTPVELAKYSGADDIEHYLLSFWRG